MLYVKLSFDSPIWVIKLSVPLELFARNKLLELQRHVHGERDDVVVENHPEQEHFEDPDEGDLLELVQIPDPHIADVGRQGVASVHLVAQHTWQVFPVPRPLDVGQVEEGILVSSKEAEHSTQTEEVGVCPLTTRLCTCIKCI